MRPITKANHLQGEIRFDGDKSISHRAAILASLAEGNSTFTNYSRSMDCLNTLICLQKLGIQYEMNDSSITIKGKGKYFQKSEEILDSGNSGTTIRLLSGVLVGQQFESILTGDSNLLGRPMERILTPLRKMGADIQGTERDTAPFFIHSVKKLNGIRYEIPIPSAQVKSCLTLAGLYANGETVLKERHETRDHTERLLKLNCLWKDDNRGPYKEIRVDSSVQVKPFTLSIPGDLSAAVFFLVAGALVKDSNLILRGVGLNPSRRLVLNVLREMGANLQIFNEKDSDLEPYGDIQISSSSLHGIELAGDWIPQIIDEIPALAIAGSTTGNFSVRDAKELRYKESDRIRAIVQNLQAMGVQIDELPDGFRIRKPFPLEGAVIDCYHDHRIAMAFAIAGLLANGITILKDPECVAISNPKFWNQFYMIQSEKEMDHELTQS